MAAGITVTHSRKALSVGRLRDTIIAWECDGSGDLSEAIGVNYKGYLVGISFNPTDAALNYDVYIKDEYGADVLSGAGVNLSDTIPSRVTPAAPIVMYGPHTIVIDEATAGKKGTVVLYTKE